MVQHGHGVHKLKGMHCRGGGERGLCCAKIMKHDLCCKVEHETVKRIFTKGGKASLNCKVL